MTNTFAGRLTTEVCAPKDSDGRPIPNAQFQLYLPGTKSAPTYYADRAKGSTRSGSPTTDGFGNVNGWFAEIVDGGSGPGIYDYWYDGQQYGQIEVTEDNGEDDAALAALQAWITDQLANYYTKDQVDEAVATGGGPTVGAELTANKNQNNGYAGLNGSAIVADAELPTNLERSTNKNANNGYIGADSSGKVANSKLYLGLIAGTHVVAKNADYNPAVVGDFVVMDTTGGVKTTTLPAPAADQPPISVLQSGANAAQISGTINGSLTTISVGINGGVLHLVSGASSWYIAGSYYPLANLARLDQDNDFADHILQNYRNNQASWTGATLRVGTAATPDIGWGVGRQLTNASGCTVTLAKTAKVGDWLVLGQGSSGQDTLAVESGGGAFLVDPDGYFKTAKQNARLYIECISNSDGNSAGFIVGGYSGA